MHDPNRNDPGWFMNDKLTPEEQEIEDQADQFVPVRREEREEVESIIERARKNRRSTST